MADVELKDVLAPNGGLVTNPTNPDPGDPYTLLVEFGTGSGQVCQGNDSRLSDDRDPNPHKTSHQSGGSDAIKLDDLAAPDDNTDLDASTGAHGLLQKLPGGTSTFLRADGTFATPTAGFDAAYYYGYSVTTVNWSSTTWVDITGALTLSDVDQVGIARTGSDWEVDDDGDYLIDIAVNVAKSSTGIHFGVRIMVNDVEVAQGAVATNNAAQLQMLHLHRRLSLVANDIITLQYCASAASSAFGTATLDGETSRIANISITRIR